MPQNKLTIISAMSKRSVGEGSIGESVATGDQDLASPQKSLANRVVRLELEVGCSGGGGLDSTCEN